MTIEVEVEAPAAITVVLPVGGRTVTLPRPRTRHRRKAAFPLAGELNRVVRRTAQIRLLLSLLLAAAACPALVSIGWRQLFTAAGPVPLIIPVAAATALALGRVRPAPGEPDVHDRQVDGLLAAGFLGAAAALLLLAPRPTPISWLLPAALAYLSAAAILLLGTRNSARMRWSLALPLVSAGALPAVLDPAVTLPGGLSPVVLPGTAVAGAIACLLVAGLATAAGAAPTFAASVFVVAVAASATVAQASIGGAATRPILVDVLLALVTTGFVARWARRDPDSGPERSYLPRGRFVFAVLVVVSGGLGAWAVLR